MAFPLDRIVLGPQHYGVRPATLGAVFHTTEGADSSLASALATIKMQSPGGSLYAGGGSYSFILTDDGPVLSVPYLEAAGGLTLLRTNPPWNPGRFPWLKQLLSPAAYDDPNAYLLQVCVSGKTAALPTYPKIARIVDDAARIVMWAEAQPEISDNLILMNHANWQTDRSDAGQWFLDQVLARYAVLKKAVPAPVTPTPNPGITDWAGRTNALGTRFPSYVHSDGQALAFLNRAIAALPNPWRR